MSHAILPHFEAFAYTSPYLPPCCTSWKELLHLASRITRKGGEPLPRVLNGEPVFYYVENGSCQTGLNMMDGSTEYIFIMSAGTLAGLPVAMGRCELPSSSLICRTSGTFWMFPQALWTEEFVSAYPRQAMECTHLLAVSTLSMTNLRILSNSGKERKLARFLCGMVHDQQSYQLVPVCSITELARMFGTHRVNLSRIVSSMVKRGILGRYDRHAIEILQPEALLDLAEGCQDFTRRQK